MSKKYHKIYFPLRDILESGGSDVFKLAREKNGLKNLVVFPSESLSSSYKIEEDGKREILRYLENFKKEGKIDINNKTTFYKLDRLDAIYLMGDFSQAQKIINEGEYSGRRIVVTNNPEQRANLKCQGYTVEKPEFLLAESSIVKKGLIVGNDSLLATLYSSRKEGIGIDDTRDLLKGREIFRNQFIKFGEKDKWVYARVCDTDNGLRAKLLGDEEYSKTLRIGNQEMQNLFGISPKDMEQYLAMQHCLLNPKIDMAIVCGGPGTGKTLLSYVAAVDSIIKYDSKTRMKRETQQKRLFDRIVLFKPKIAVGGKEYEEGYLPGDLWQKKKDTFASFIDAHELSNINIPFTQMILNPREANAFGPKRESNQINGGFLPERKEAIEITSPAYARGRTFENCVMLIDEPQNFTPYLMKTLLSRMGQGSKCIVIGDPEQLDNPKCSEDMNGLTSTVKNYIGSEGVSLIYLTSHYRHKLALKTRGWRAPPR